VSGRRSSSRSAGSAFLPLVVIAVDRFIIRRGERYLAHAFPREYAGYRERVRRWM